MSIQKGGLFFGDILVDGCLVLPQLVDILKYVPPSYHMNYFPKTRPVNRNVPHEMSLSFCWIAIPLVDSLVVFCGVRSVSWKSAA